jgi:hypothetical protein
MAKDDIHVRIQDCDEAMAPIDIYIRHYIGHCALCGFPVFDMGNSDELEHDFMFNLTFNREYSENDWFFRTFHRDVYNG